MPTAVPTGTSYETSEPLLASSTCKLIGDERAVTSFLVPM